MRGWGFCGYIMKNYRTRGKEKWPTMQRTADKEKKAVNGYRNVKGILGNFDSLSSPPVYIFFN